MFVPAPTKINETDLRVDFNEFARKMRCKWFFPNEPTENFNEVPASALTQIATYLRDTLL